MGKLKLTNDNFLIFALNELEGNIYCLSNSNLIDVLSYLKN